MTLGGIHPLPLLEALVLVSLANGTPVIVKKLMAERLAFPVDGGARFADGRPWLGPSKTVRGVVSAILVTAAGAAAMGLGWSLGALAGLAAMIGDLLSSFSKRRMARASSGRSLVLDQVPESLLPLLVAAEPLGLSLLDVGLGVVLFFVAEIAASRVLFKLKIRDRPY